MALGPRQLTSPEWYVRSVRAIYRLVTEKSRAYEEEFDMLTTERIDEEFVRGYCRRCGFPFGDRAAGQGVCNWPSACDKRLHDPTFRVWPDRLAAVEVRVRQHLIQGVKDAGIGHPFEATISYTDLCKVIDPEQHYWSSPLFQGVGKLLNRISAYEHQRGRPLLSALVVQVGTHHPGDGFVRLARSLGQKTPAEPGVGLLARPGRGSSTVLDSFGSGQAKSFFYCAPGGRNG